MIHWGNGLVPMTQHTFTWTNDDKELWHPVINIISTSQSRHSMLMYLWDLQDNCGTMIDGCLLKGNGFKFYHL